ncbi:MAG: enoyl-CoA hydratase/isomerase family protein [Proteobacteria bacterium]|nr:enoyl-CoA hydratase/isomerase family protein [Pseudomonadota bacterium]
MDFGEILYETKDHVALITLNRPQARNALTMKTYGEVVAALERIEADPEIRAAVITGAGTGFCSGDDVKQVMLDPQEVERRRERAKAQVRAEPTPAAAALMSMSKPIIAAVNGPAVGWGMDLALMCDIRMASPRAKFGEIFVLRGLIPDLGGIYWLPRIVGLSKAYELLFTGEVIDAEEALKIGLVSRVVPPEALLDEALALAQRIAANPPLAVRRIKEAVRRGLDYDLQALGEYVTSSLGVLFATEDHKEGAMAFLEKRAPKFKGC